MKVNCTGHERCPFRGTTECPLVGRSESWATAGAFSLPQFPKLTHVRNGYLLSDESARGRVAVYGCAIACKGNCGLRECLQRASVAIKANQM